MGGGKGSNTTKSTFKLPPEFIKAYSESLGLAREAINQPYTPYTGQLVAGLTPTQQQGLSNVNASQGMALPAIQRGMGYTEEAARGITPELYDRFYSPYVRDVANATQANLLESAAQQRSGLKGGAIQAGAFGGDRSGIAQAEMSRQQQLANAQAMSNIYNQGYGQAMGLAGQQVANLGAMGQQMAGLGTTAQTSALQGAQAQLAAGAQEQATAQAQLQAAYDQFLQQQSYPFQIAQYFANIAQGLGSTAGGTSSTTAPGPSAGSQIMGGIGALGSIASMASDKRMKENIEAVGTLNDGQTVYRYNFKGDPKTQIGLLAQEVEERNPGAVTEVKGLKMVDYRDATEVAQRGVVGPGDDRQGFMNGGMPYGGSGFIPNNPMMTAASSKIPDAVTPTPDAGLAGAAMSDPFTDQQKEGFGNIAGMFQKPSIYNAGGVVGRNAYAEGGVPFMPYSGGSGFIPEGKIGGGGSAIPSEPDAYVDKGLSESWQDIKPFTDEQKDNLSLLPGKIRAMFSDPDMAASGYLNQPSVYEMGNPQIDVGPMPPTTYRFASGGVAGRGGYQFGGEPTMEEAMDEAEAMREPKGVSGAEYPRLIQRESGGNYGARNKQGYVGRGQFGDARLEEARRAGVLPEGMDKEGFRLNPQVQQDVEKWHFSDINNFIDNRGLGSFEGKSVRGIPVTREGLVNVAHLGGKGGLEKFITSGGRYNPADANGTRLSDYLAMGAQSGGVGAATAPSGYSNTQIMPVSAEEAPNGVSGAEQGRTPFSLKKLFASEENPSIIESIMGRRMSPEARNAVLNASFALMAGKSPFFMTNLGEAGRVGTQTYYSALQQKRELEKQRADIARQGFEAETGRMGVEVQERNAMRQQAALVLPIVRNLISLGQPVPPYLMNLLEGAYPVGSPERAEFDAQVSGEGAGMSAPVDVKALPGPQAVPVQEGTNSGNIGVTPVPPPDSEGALPPAAPTPPEGEAVSLLSKLPPGQNPYALLEAADRAAKAGDPELYQSLLEQSQKLMQDYKATGIPMPDGTVVPFPGSQESLARGERLKTLATGEATQVNEYNKGISEAQSTFNSRGIVVDGLRQALSTAETGKFAELKADLVNAAASLGLANSEQIAEAEDIQIAMKYFAQGILDSGMKDSIGPQISNADLILVAKGQGTVENLPVANRKIVGAMYGKLMYDRAKNAAFDNFVAERGGLASVTPTDIRNWERNFSKTEPVSKYIEQGIANTPVAGELDATRPPDYLKPGYKYVHPNGRVFLYKGTKEVNGQTVQDAEWVK